jgi:hypothetical protein
MSDAPTPQPDGALPVSPPLTAEERATLAAHIPNCTCDYSQWVAALLAENKRLRAALTWLAECNLSEENCASFDVANRRIRGIAVRALGPASPQP